MELWKWNGLLLNYWCFITALQVFVLTDDPTRRSLIHPRAQALPEAVSSALTLTGHPAHPYGLVRFSEKWTSRAEIPAQINIITVR